MLSGFSHPWTIGYDEPTGTYVVRESGGQEIAFSANEIVAAESDETFTTYLDTTTGIKFKLLKSGIDNKLISLEYVTFGSWNHSIDPPEGYAEASEYNWMVFGSPTRTDQIPRVGTATYFAILTGNYVNTLGVYDVTGEGGLTIDFNSIVGSRPH